MKNFLIRTMSLSAGVQVELVNLLDLQALQNSANSDDDNMDESELRGQLLPFHFPCLVTPDARVFRRCKYNETEQKSQQTIGAPL